MSKVFKNARSYSLNLDYFALLIEQIQDKHGISLRQLAAQIGASYSSVKTWKYGTRTPSYCDQFTLEALRDADSVREIVKNG